MTQTAAKKDYDYIFLELARSLCPVCLKLIDAKLILKENKIFMLKTCPNHGFFEVLIFSDAEMYFKGMRFNKPGTIPLHFETQVKNGCPYDCGLCPEHQQHSCLGILEIIESCNLECPTCFSDSSPALKGYLSLDQIKFMMDKFVEQEGNPEVIQLSGGEPTLHPDLIQIVKEAKKRGIRSVMINTNGLKLAHDQRFREQLAEVKPHLYLQFDGFKESTYEILRGKKDFLKDKLKAIEAAAQAGLNVILAVTIQKGVNEDELGEIVKFAKETPGVRGVSFQPTTYVQRHPEFDAKSRITNSDVIHLIAQQSGLLEARDFIPVPCCYPNCQYVTYVYRDGKNFIPISRVIDLENYLDYIKNRSIAYLNQEEMKKVLQEAVEGLWSASSVIGSEKTSEKLKLACCGMEEIEGIGEFNRLADNMMMFSIIAFLDSWTFDVKRVMKCCVAEICPDGRIIPFCAYNVLYRNGGGKSGHKNP